MTSSFYLYYPGTFDEALALYAEAFGGATKGKMTYSQMPPNPQMVLPAGYDSKIMHAFFEAPGLRLMGSDVPPDDHKHIVGIDLEVSVDTPEAAEHTFKLLAEGGTITVPMAETFWAHRFGKVKDRFGVPWMINCNKPMPQ